MKKVLPCVDIESPISVTSEDVRDAEKIENDFIKMLQLMDLLILCQEQETIYS